MAVQVEMPKLSLTMSEGTVLHWMKKVGDPVKKGEALVEVSSDKEVCELDSPEDGILLNVVAPEGESVACHAVIAYIGHPEEQFGNNNKVEVIKSNSIEAPKVNNQSTSEQVSATSVKGHIKISPVARKMAAQADLDISILVGTGPNGRITKEDIEKALEERKKVKVSEKSATQELISATPKQVEPSAKVGVSTEQVEKAPLIGMRKVIAKRMHESLQQSAQLTHHTKVDITELLALKKKTATHVEKRLNGKLTVTDFIARAVVLSLQEHKQMNSALIDDEIHFYNHIHLGIAVDVENGLVVPVINQAESKSLIELSISVKELSVLAKSKQLGSNQMKGSTFTISNLGSFGIEYFTPILNPPETGILGVGTAQATPVFIGEEIQKRYLLPLSLTFNHQVIDGAPAATFLQTVKEYLEEPTNLLL